MTRNERYYEERKVVEHYARLDELQKPEQTFLDQFMEELRGTRFLDLGVGGGRTTLPFSSHVKEYVGVDYSTKMVQACKRRFKGLTNAEFEVGDARSLDMFPSGHFGAVLFSYNGIDEVPPEGRQEVLAEVFRVLAPSGPFLFSTHNLNFIKKLFGMSFMSGPRRYLMLRAINRGRRPTGDEYGLFDDCWWDLRHRMDTHYISPRYQVEQLRHAGFTAIRGFSVETGREFGTLDELYDSDEPWVYYLCIRP